jgi:hypothetical protein
VKMKERRLNVQSHSFRKPESEDLQRACTDYEIVLVSAFEARSSVVKRPDSVLT